jgi:hypothetical protein
MKDLLKFADKIMFIIFSNIGIVKYNIKIVSLI